MPGESLVRDVARIDLEPQAFPASEIHGADRHQDAGRGGEGARREGGAALVRFLRREIARGDGAGGDVRLVGRVGDPVGRGGVEAGVGPTGSPIPVRTILA